MTIDERRLWAEFCAICDCGGRQSGTPSEAAAVALLSRLGAEATGVAVQEEAVAYRGWRAVGGRLELPDGGVAPVNPLLRSAATPPGGLVAEVVDLGRGTPEDVAAHAGALRGRIALVRHELMFAAGTVHRRVKYRAAAAAGAVGFLIAGPAAGSMVAGSTGRGEEPGVPAAGVSPETAAALRPTGDGWPRVRLVVDVEEGPATASNLLFDAPGGGPGRVVLSAHIDGHALGESALDNASGLAVALAVARVCAPMARRARRGLRLALFNVEEWALTGSAAHVAALDAVEREGVALNVNLDTVAGGARLTALTSGFGAIEPFLAECAAAADVPLGLHRPLQVNSDHANFAVAGIPAFRLVAGFDDPSAETRLLLTAGDTRDRARPGELLRAARLALEIVARALSADDDVVQAWRSTR